MLSSYGSSYNPSLEAGTLRRIALRAVSSRVSQVVLREGLCAEKRAWSILRYLSRRWVIWLLKRARWAGSGRAHKTKRGSFWRD